MSTKFYAGQKDYIIKLNELDDNFTAAASALNGASILTKSVAGTGSVTLTNIEAGNGYLVFTGALTGNRTVVVPNTPNNWFIFNNTTGAFSLTVKTAAGTGVAVVQGKRKLLACDGTNVFTPTSDMATISLDGMTGGTVSGDLKVTGTFITEANTASPTVTRVNHTDDTSDVTLMRVNANGFSSADKSAYGFSLKYMGSRSGNDNSLSFWTDNQLSATQVEALRISQDGSIATSGAVDVGGNLKVTGNLTVNGTTTTVNSTTVTVDDPIFTLGGDTAPTTDDAKDRGIEYRWHNGTTAKIGFFGFDRSTGKMIFIPDATNTNEVFTGTAGTIVANLEGAVTGNASSATKLQTARTIAGVSFDGTADISLTKSNVGLANVDNTSDANKPVSTATQTALNAKLTTADIGQYAVLSANGLSADISGTTLNSQSTLGFYRGNNLTNAPDAGRWFVLVEAGSSTVVKQTVTAYGEGVDRPTYPAGTTFLRINVNGTWTSWQSVGGGATGGGSNKAFYENDVTITESYTITSGKNAGSFGPITIADGAVVTVPDGSVWTIV